VPAVHICNSYLPNAASRATAKNISFASIFNKKKWTRESSTASRPSYSNPSAHSSWRRRAIMNRLLPRTTENVSSGRSNRRAHSPSVVFGGVSLVALACLLLSDLDEDALGIPHQFAPVCPGPLGGHS
jgi:hypothetical protein